MPETYLVTVKTADGRLLISQETTGNLSNLCHILLQLFNLFWLQFEDTDEYKTRLGSGTQSSASHSQSPTES
jgi:hypothetical protein